MGKKRHSIILILHVSSQVNRSIFQSRNHSTNMCSAPFYFLLHTHNNNNTHICKSWNSRPSSGCGFLSAGIRGIHHCILNFHLYLNVCCVSTCTCQVQVWRSEHLWQELVVAFHRVGSRDLTQVLKLCSKHLNLLNHRSGPFSAFYMFPFQMSITQQ